MIVLFFGRHNWMLQFHNCYRFWNTLVNIVIVCPISRVSLVNMIFGSWSHLYSEAPYI